MQNAQGHACVQAGEHALTETAETAEQLAAQAEALGTAEAGCAELENQAAAAIEAEGGSGNAKAGDDN